MYAESAMKLFVNKVLQGVAGTRARSLGTFFEEITFSKSFLLM
jgi:hypothetical protein